MVLQKQASVTVVLSDKVDFKTGKSAGKMDGIGKHNMQYGKPSSDKNVSYVPSFELPT